MKELKVILGTLLMIAGIIVCTLLTTLMYMTGELASIFGGSTSPWVGTIVVFIVGLAIVWLGLRLRRNT